MLAICAVILVGLMVAIGGERHGETSGLRSVPNLQRQVAVETGLLLSSGDGLALRGMHEDGEQVLVPLIAPARLVIGGLATGDGEPAVTVTAAAVEPTQAIPEPTATRKESLPVGPADIIALIVQYDWPDDVAIRIADCESDFNPNAYNASGASGIFQFLPRFHNWKLRAGESWFDARANIRIAYETWLADGGFSAWEASRHCWGN